ncbi:MAG TPA: carboxypeptidase-like regulatory domain-containing protein [Chitinophagaceae bacterium]
MELDNFKYNLSKLKKCDQYWDEMNPVLGGRLCSKCDKKIIDFSNMSFTDIAFFLSESKEPVCGFYLPEQLKEIKSLNLKFPIAAGLSTLIATTSFAEKETSSQISIVNIENKQSKTTIDSGINLFDTSIKIDTFYISGRIEYFDTTTNKYLPVEFASIFIKGTNQGVTTDKMGNFKLRYQTSDTGTISILITSIGLMTHEISGIELKDKAEIELGTIKMEKWKGEVIEFYVTTKKRSGLNRFWRKVTKPFRR